MAKTRTRRALTVWEELVRFLNSRSYASKVEIAQAIAAIGNIEDVGRVITQARRNGQVVVYSYDRQLYTSKPNGMEVIADLLRRYKTVGGLCNNADGLIDYYTTHKKRLAAGLDKDNKQQVAAIIAAIKKLQVAWTRLRSSVL